ncbi:IclR family transcriptional regulator [soil metagenome]
MNDSRPQQAARSVGAVVHALRILRHLASQGTPSGVTAISRATGINTSTCFNILRTLAAERLVVFDPAAKTYRLGLGVVELAVGLLGASHADLIRPELERLARSYPALLCLWHITDNERIVLVDRVYASTSVRIDMHIGTRLPSFIGAIGRCVAALRQLDDTELRGRFSGLRWQNPPSFAAYRADVRAARQDGYARDRGNLFAGVDIVASIVVDQDGRPRYGLSGIAISGQVEDAGMRRLGLELREVGRRARQALFAPQSAIEGAG